jgi:uncharacterized protein (DUF58 family)
MKRSLKKILLKTKKQVYGDMLGNNPSPFHGEGFEFSELREYIYGDDIRKIDWKSTAKLGRPFVKLYKEERQLNVVVVSVLSGSTYFGTVRQKSELMMELVATLGFSAIKSSDLFSHILFADQLYSLSKPSKKLFSVHRAVEEMESFEMLGKESNFEALVELLNQRLKKRSLLFILSDFVGDIDLRLLSKKHDIVAVMVRDRFEEYPERLGYLNLVDMQSSREFEGSVDTHLLRGYTKALRVNDERLYAHFKEQGVRVAKIYTHQEGAMELMRRMR